MNNYIQINYLHGNSGMRVEPLSLKRDWMKETTNSYAYHCLPLNIANEYGWQVLSPSDFSATWDGGNGQDAIAISHNSPATSIFGFGVLTIHVDFIIRTNSGVSTYARGIPNKIMDGLEPLDGIVETDWLPFTFTYNYKFTRPGTVEFKKDEPLFSFFPVQRGFIESFDISATNIDSDPEFAATYREYARSRSEHISEGKYGHQKYYTSGTDSMGCKYNIQNHIRKLKINDILEK